MEHITQNYFLVRALRGLNEVVQGYLSVIYEDMLKYDAIPGNDYRCEQAREILHLASLGQLHRLSKLQEKWKGFEFYSLEPDTGNINIKICGMVGALDPDGNIHT